MSCSQSVIEVSSSTEPMSPAVVMELSENGSESSVNKILDIDFAEFLQFQKEAIKQKIQSRFDTDTIAFNKRFELGEFCDYYEGADMFQKSVGEIHLEMAKQFQTAQQIVNNDVQICDPANDFQSQINKRTALFDSTISICGQDGGSQLPHTCQGYSPLTTQQLQVSNVQQELKRLHFKFIQPRFHKQWSEIGERIQTLENEYKIKYIPEADRFVQQLSEQDLNQVTFEHLFIEKVGLLYIKLTCPVCGVTVCLDDYIGALSQTRHQALIQEISDFIFEVFLTHMVHERLRVAGLFIQHQHHAVEAVWRAVTNDARIRIIKSKLTKNVPYNNE